MFLQDMTDETDKAKTEPVFNKKPKTTGYDPTYKRPCRSQIW